MKPNRIAQVVTVTVLAIALGAGLLLKNRSRSEAPASQDPQSTVYAMLNAARSGDVRSYLAAFTGPMEATLRQGLAETTISAFAKYLRDSNAEIRGIAVSDPQEVTDREVKVRVEYVYQDRNEAQMMYLEKGRQGWKISRSDNDQRVKTLIPYGTPVR